jgi:hypothetical protein
MLLALARRLEFFLADAFPLRVEVSLLDLARQLLHVAVSDALAQAALRRKRRINPPVQNSDSDLGHAAGTSWLGLARLKKSKTRFCPKSPLLCVAKPG